MLTVAAERAVAHVDLGAITANCRRLREAAPGAELCAVVKANGYGHGAEQCARAAVAGGAGWLAVATAGEATELRAAGIEARILVMGSLTARDLAEALAADADIVAWRTGFVDRARAVAGVTGARVHVKLDSGMGRLGTSDPAEAAAICEQVAAAAELELAGVMTHFATADELGDDHFPVQLERFRSFADAVRDRHPGIVRHAANSAATFRDRASHFDLVRCGIAVYGLDPFQGDPRLRGLQPALQLESYVAAVKHFSKGDSAGYGRTWAAPGETDVGVVPIGYGDGIRRALSNSAEVLIAGRRRPVVGTISMDNLTVDLGPGSGIEPGEPVVLIGEQQGERILCEEVAGRLETINYEVTCSLTPRVRRSYGPQ